MAILIPFYNEEADELMMTIKSLFEGFGLVEEMGYSPHILLIMDGWWKSSESMKKKMMELFPHDDKSKDKPWWEMILPIGKDDDISECVSTFVLQNVSRDDQTIVPVDIGGNNMVKLTCLIKRDNRKKVNSQTGCFRLLLDFITPSLYF